jgi:oxaloacetate decarboxylase gamma subunit
MIMNIEELITQGVELMLLGMGMVFFILSLLIFILKGTSALIHKYAPHIEPLISLPQSHSIPEKPVTDPELLTAISIAIHRYRSNS